MEDKRTKSGVSRRKLVLTGLAAAGTAASWPLIRRAHGQAKAEHTMVFAHTFTKASEKFVVTGIDLFKELAEKYSQGKLLVDVHEGGKLGGQNVLPQKVLSGLVHATQLSTQNFTPYSEAFNLLDMPYLFPTSEALESTLENPWFMQSKFNSEPEKKGYRILAGMWSNSGYRVLGVGQKRPREIRVPADLKGIKLRVNPARVEQQAWTLTPASQVTIDWAETYQAMQQGVADGLNVGVGPLTASRIYETMSSATMIDMTFNAHVTLVGLDWYRKLPSAIQEAIQRAAAESWDYQKKQQRKANVEMLALWKSKGIKIITLTPDERKAWVAATNHTRPEWESYKDKYGRAEYEMLVKLAKA